MFKELDFHLCPEGCPPQTPPSQATVTPFRSSGKIFCTSFQPFVSKSMSHSSGQRSFFVLLADACQGSRMVSNSWVTLSKYSLGSWRCQRKTGNSRKSPSLQGRWPELGCLGKTQPAWRCDTYYTYLHQASPTLLNSSVVSLTQNSLGWRQVNIPIWQAADISPICYKSNQYPC